MIGPNQGSCFGGAAEAYIRLSSAFKVVTAITSSDGASTAVWGKSEGQWRGPAPRGVRLAAYCYVVSHPRGDAGGRSPQGFHRDITHKKTQCNKRSSSYFSPHDNERVSLIGNPTDSQKRNGRCHGLLFPVLIHSQAFRKGAPTGDP
ncbi:hypothetical protein VUR80DRAFT_9904 [Thermomyces stellatus]